MFVLCPKCKNHYDDSSQSAKCAGIGVTASKPTAAGSAHEVIASLPVEDHVAATRRAKVIVNLRAAT